jgi:hypothetical protein
MRLTFEKSVIIVTNPDNNTKGDLIKALSNIKTPENKIFETHIGNSILKGKWKPISEYNTKK